MQIEVEAAFAAAVDALERVPRALEPFRALGDDALLAHDNRWEITRRRASTHQNPSTCRVGVARSAMRWS